MKIQFNEENHQYTVDGKIVPCVSNIMKCVSCLYYTDDIPSEIIELARLKGEAVHKAIESLLLFDEYDLDENYQSYMNNFLKWFNDYNPEIIKVEYQMSNGEYAGTCDLVCKINNEYIGVDYKLTSKIHTELVAVQEAGYDELLKYNKINIKKWYVLHLTKKDYEFKEINIRKDIWDFCKKIYFYMKGD